MKGTQRKKGQEQSQKTKIENQVLSQSNNDLLEKIALQTKTHEKQTSKLEKETQSIKAKFKEKENKYKEQEKTIKEQVKENKEQEKRIKYKGRQ